MNLSKYMGAVALGVALVGAPSVRAFGEDVQYKDITRDDMPRETRHEADAQSKGGSDVQYQRQSRDGKTFYSVHWTKDGKRMEVRLDDAGKVVNGPSEARSASSGSKESDANTKGDDAGVKFKGVSASDVPESVRKTMDKYTKGSRDPQYQSQLRDGKTFYSVHYTTTDNKRMFIRVDDKGQLALGPAESTAQKPKIATPEASKTTAKLETKREAVNVDQLPAAVRKTVETATSGGTDHTFVKQTRGDEVTYVVEYNKNGSRTSALIDPEGKIVEGEAFAAAPPAPTPTPAPPDAAVKNASDAQLAAAREQANAPYLLLNSADQLPAEVRAAAEKEMAGATNPMFQRYMANGQTAYSVYFSNDKGRHFMAIDQSGKVVIEPRKSKWQEGGKAAKFEAIGADQLPAEVRKTIEAQNGAAHVFVKRTTPNGRQDYLVQFNDASGQRMEAEVSAEGKLIGKARKAEEQPLAILGKKKG